MAKTPQDYKLPCDFCFEADDKPGKLGVIPCYWLGFITGMIFAAGACTAIIYGAPYCHFN